MSKNIKVVHDTEISSGLEANCCLKMLPKTHMNVVGFIEWPVMLVEG
jgi:hypothetical protein